jgi:hypothetical protein
MVKMVDVDGCTALMKAMKVMKVRDELHRSQNVGRTSEESRKNVGNARPDEGATLPPLVPQYYCEQRCGTVCLISLAQLLLQKVSGYLYV